MNGTPETSVFVYGSLRRGESNDYLLAAAATSELVSAVCRVRGQLYDTGCGYPALVLSDTSWTTGELYRVTPDVLQQLDELEGYQGEGLDNDYNRERILVVVDDQTVHAYVYTYTEEQVVDMRPIQSGDWVRCHHGAD